MRSILSLTFALSMPLAGCSTTQQVTLGKANHDKPIQSVAQVLDEGNSPQMNDNLLVSLQGQGLTVKPTLPLGTTKNQDADALVSYVDVWRWDLVMYLKNLTVKLYDASSGDLLAIGQWSDSPLHGFRDSKAVMDGLVKEMLDKVKGSKKVADAK